VGGAAEEWYPAEAHFAANEIGKASLTLLPRNFRIESGVARGTLVNISPLAAARASGGGRFWRLTRSSDGNGWNLVTWRSSAFPLRLALDAAAGDRINASDSSTFWEIVNRFEQTVGRKFFQATARAMRDAPDVVVLSLSPKIAAEALTSISWTGDGAINDGEIQFRNIAELRDAHVVAHELMHLLGVGHTGAWSTIMTPYGTAIAAPTAHDIAYLQLMYMVRDMRDQHGGRFGVAEAVEGERTVAAQLEKVTRARGDTIR
jgi:hypothetical protein